MLDQEYDLELYDQWLTEEEQLTRFSKAREKIVGRTKGSESTFVQGPQSSEEDLVVRERVPISIQRTSVIETGTNCNHAPIGQEQNGGSSDRQEILVSIDNVRPQGNEEQYVTSSNGKALGINVHVRRSERIRNYPQQYNPRFGAAIEWNNDDVASIVYMIQDRDLNRNVDNDDIILFLGDWYAEDCMDTPQMFHIRDYYVLKTQSHDNDTPTYMEALSGKNSEEYFRATNE